MTCVTGEKREIDDVKLEPINYVLFGVFGCIAAAIFLTVLAIACIRYCRYRRTVKSTLPGFKPLVDDDTMQLHKTMNRSQLLLGGDGDIDVIDMRGSQASLMSPEMASAQHRTSTSAVRASSSTELCEA